MADDRKQKTDESRLNDVLAGDDELGRGSEPRDDRSDSLTIPADDRAMDDQERGSEEREEQPEEAR